MLNLYNTTYGIGIQSGTMYFRKDARSDGKFAWFAGGSHVDASGDPAGPGGRVLMTLDDIGTLRPAGGLVSPNGVLTVGGGIRGGFLDIAVQGQFGSQLIVGGNVTAQAFITSSDRNTKHEIRSISTEQVLRDVVALPITRWKFLSQVSDHIGPMAQDFRRIFRLGDSDKHIGLGDAMGVSFAAIQGLNQKLAREVKLLQAKLSAKDEESAKLKARLAAIEKKLGLN
jgi:Chaperone of endosialidase